ncbi:hypothetical protein L1887_24946 [Cichorium endivia]|nr:hypothetical protein L1887_24946 [Cichorium endivia]
MADTVRVQRQIYLYRDRNRGEGWVLLNRFVYHNQDPSICQQENKFQFVYALASSSIAGLTVDGVGDDIFSLDVFLYDKDTNCTINMNHHSFIAFTKSCEDTCIWNMDSHLSFLVLFSLVMISITAYARPNPEEYGQDWRVRGGSLVSPHPTKKSPCNTLTEASNQRMSSNEDFEPRPNISVYDNGASLKSKKTFDEEFEPRPSTTAYGGASLKDKKTFDEEFEPRPSTTAYGSASLKDKKTFEEEFEPRPSTTSYGV